MRLSLGKIVKLKSGNGTIFVQTTEAAYEGGLVQAGGPDIEKNLDKMLDAIKPFCKSIVNAFEGLEGETKKPDSLTAEFGLSIAAGADLFIVKASGEATIKITLKWGLNDS